MPTPKERPIPFSSDMIRALLAGQLDTAGLLAAAQRNLELVTSTSHIIEQSMQLASQVNLITAAANTQQEEGAAA